MKTQELDHLITDNPPCPTCGDCGETIFSTEPFVMSGGVFFHAPCYERAMDEIFSEDLDETY